MAQRSSLCCKHLTLRLFVVSSAKESQFPSSRTFHPRSCAPLSHPSRVTVQSGPQPRRIPYLCTRDRIRGWPRQSNGTQTRLCEQPKASQGHPPRKSPYCGIVHTENKNCILCVSNRLPKMGQIQKTVNGYHISWTTCKWTFCPLVQNKVVFASCSHSEWKVDWFWEFQEQKSWVDPSAPSTSTARPNRFGRKTMLCVWWDQTRYEDGKNV